MKFDGMDFKRVNHLYFRMSQEGDLDEHGNQMHKHYCAFVYLKDCKVEKDDLGYRVPDASIATAIAGRHSLTNMMYGKARKRNNGYPTWVWDREKRVHVLASDYWTVPVYLAYNGRVYTSSTRHL